MSGHIPDSKARGFTNSKVSESPGQSPSVIKS